MGHQIDHEEHEKFLRDFKSLPLTNEEIAERLGTDKTRISHYRKGGKWPSKNTLNLFYSEFRNDLEAIEDEKIKKENRVLEQLKGGASRTNQVDPSQYCLTNPTGLILYHMALAEKSLIAIKTAIEAAIES
ncbi:MAG TPA: hypothetical protein VGM30_24910 [Puia sp.]|jgi:transcriptional regulator with XRE-family HTH domain